MLKYCGKCNQDVPVSRFHKNACKKDGLQSWCVVCQRDVMRARERAVKNPQKKRRTEPRKIASRAKYKQALRKEELVRGECAAVGDPHEGQIEGHHLDYDLPLCVVWLCRKHHGMADRKYR